MLPIGACTSPNWLTLNSKCPGLQNRVPQHNVVTDCAHCTITSSNPHRSGLQKQDYHENVQYTWEGRLHNPVHCVCHTIQEMQQTICRTNFADAEKEILQTSNPDQESQCNQCPTRNWQLLQVPRHAQHCHHTIAHYHAITHYHTRCR